MNRNHSVRIKIRENEDRKPSRKAMFATSPDVSIFLHAGGNSNKLFLTVGKTVSRIEIRETREEAKQA